jgi:hypothetical protein
MRELGEPVALDHSKFRPLEQVLCSRQYGLVGKFDQLYLPDEGTAVPVEYKSSPMPERGPWFSDVMQIISYCINCKYGQICFEAFGYFDASSPGSLHSGSNSLLNINH